MTKAQRTRYALAPLLLTLAVCACSEIPGTFRPGPQPVPGQRVRVKVRDVQPSSRIGTFIARTADSLVLSMDTAATPAADASRTVYPVSGVTRFEVSLGVRRHTVEGAAIGGSMVLLGSLVGLAFGACVQCEAELTAVFLGGIAVGAAVGSLVEKETWRRRPLRSVHVTVVPLSGGGLGVGATLAVQ